VSRRWGRIAALVVVGVVVAGVAGLIAVGPKRILAASGFIAAEERLTTGLLVTGTPARPVLYVTSSDPRIGAGPDGVDLDLDTNSGVISRLTRDGSRWRREDLVRGLPRSEENHATNGLALDTRRHVLYVAQGGNTDKGAPSDHFAFLPEYSLSAAILAVDLGRIHGTYDLPTAQGTKSPFGGDDGRNQASVVPGGPVRVYAPGFRNPYDLVLGLNGDLYTIDNGGGFDWGDRPLGCTNAVRNSGSYEPDILHVITRAGYYGGHPNPTRAGGAAALAAVTGVAAPGGRPDPRQCRYVSAASNPRALARFETSTNGLAQYTAPAFGGAMRGDLLTASIDHRLYRIHLDPTGRRALSKTPFATVEGFPLDVTTQPAGGPFRGTVWASDYETGAIHVYEPRDYELGPHWAPLAPSGLKRQEVAAVRVGRKIYVGAGGSTRQQVYDLATDHWSDVEPLPEKLDHIQAVAIGPRIYYVGGLIGWPKPATDSVYVYDTRTNRFTRAAPMPAQRGAGGVAVHAGKIYYAGGLADGIAVTRFEVYDPSTDRWSRLPDLPEAKDHFQAAVLDGRFYAIGGRAGDLGTETRSNFAYDFATRRWVTGLSELPTARGGFATAVLDGRILVMGGEGPDGIFHQVEAYDPARDSWRELEPMPSGRHGIEAVVCGGAVYVIDGGAQPYGGHPTDTTQVYLPQPRAGCGPSARAGEAPHAVAFRAGVVSGARAEAPTAMQFGPDGRLYVAQEDGHIVALGIGRTGPGAYEVTSSEAIDEIREIPNHNDDGSSATSWRVVLGQIGKELGICCAPKEAGITTAPRALRDGRRLFTYASCAGCHALAKAGSTAVSGPPLDNLAGAPAAFVRESIVDPNALLHAGYGPDRMPLDYRETLTRAQIDAIVAYLTSGP